jgi:hypothetical protein
MQFNSRFHELLNTAFSYEVTKPIFDNIKATIIGEIPYQSERFGFPVSMDSWDVDMRRVDWFLCHRGEMIQEPLQVLVLGMPEAQQNQILCYPNPFSGELHICFDAEAFDKDEIAIYDMMGRKVFAQPYLFTEGENHITIGPDLPSGLYLLKVGSYSQRILKY